MPVMSQPTFAPKLSLGFITAGALFGVWTLVWRYTVAPDELSPNQKFFYYGVLLSGITVLIIGAFLGTIGRAARKVELPPVDDTARGEAVVPGGVVPPAGAVMAPGTVPGAAVPAGAVPAAPAAAPAGTTAPAYRR